MSTTFRVAFWLTVAAVLFFTLRTLTVIVPGSDKTQHAITFGILMLIVVPAYPQARLAALAVSLSGFGAAIELIQPYFGRSDDIRDWIADVIGISVGLLIVTLVRKLMLLRRNPAP